MILTVFCNDWAFKMILGEHLRSDIFYKKTPIYFISSFLISKL